MRITIEGHGGLDDPRQRILAIEAAVESICREAGTDPADAAMMLLTAAVHVTSRYSKMPANILGMELAHALGGAIVAADQMFKLRPAVQKPTYQKARFDNPPDEGFDGDKGREANDYPYGEEPGR